MKRERLEELVGQLTSKMIDEGCLLRPVDIRAIRAALLAVERETVERVVAGIDANPKPFTSAGICERELAKHVARSLLTEET